MQEILANEERNSHQIQMKKKDEEINKMKLKINEKDRDIDKGKKKNENLADELLEMQKKYNIQNKDMEIIGEREREQRNKNDIKALNTANYIIKDYVGKLRQFGEALYNYSEMKFS